jgi:hypothetical protein
MGRACSKRRSCLLLDLLAPDLSATAKPIECGLAIGRADLSVDFISHRTLYHSSNCDPREAPWKP